MSRKVSLLLATLVAVAGSSHATVAAPADAARNTDFSAQVIISRGGTSIVIPQAQQAPQAQPAPQGGRPGRPAAAPPPAGRPTIGTLTAPGLVPNFARQPAASPRAYAPGPHYGGRYAAPPPRAYGPRDGGYPRYAPPPQQRFYGGGPAYAPPRGSSRPVSYIRGPHYVHRRGVARRLAAVGGLSALAIGSRYYYPYAYVPLRERLCTGETPEGCELDWAEVPTDDGALEQQCVAYCPR
jgi:hypothetical protein